MLLDVSCTVSFPVSNHRAVTIQMKYGSEPVIDALAGEDLWKDLSRGEILEAFQYVFEESRAADEGALILAAD